MNLYFRAWGRLTDLKTPHIESWWSQWGSHGSLLLLFMMKVIVSHFVIDIHKVMTTPILVVLVLVLLEFSLQSHRHTSISERFQIAQSLLSTEADEVSVFPNLHRMSWTKQFSYFNHRFGTCMTWTWTDMQVHSKHVRLYEGGSGKTCCLKRVLEEGNSEWQCNNGLAWAGLWL